MFGDTRKTPEYTLEDAKAEAFDLLWAFVKAHQHSTTWQAFMEDAMACLTDGSMLPPCEETVGLFQGWITEFARDHMEKVNLSAGGHA